MCQIGAEFRLFLKKPGARRDELIKIGYSRAYISEALALAKIPPYLRVFCKEGTICESDLIVLLRLCKNPKYVRNVIVNLTGTTGQKVSRAEVRALAKACRLKK